MRTRLSLCLSSAGPRVSPGLWREAVSAHAQHCSRPPPKGTARPLARGAGNARPGSGARAVQRLTERGRAVWRLREGAPGELRHKRPAACAYGARASRGLGRRRRVRAVPPWALFYFEALVLLGLWGVWAFASYFIMEDAAPGASDAAPGIEPDAGSSWSWRPEVSQSSYYTKPVTRSVVPRTVGEGVWKCKRETTRVA